jgi:YjjG family noncanonical pyrimidine nucleotidase
MENAMKYKTILFDADGTLFDFLHSEASAIRKTMTTFNIEPDDEKVNTYSVINDGLWKMLERGEIEKKVLLYRRFELFCEHYGFECDAKEMARTYMNELSENAYLYEGAEDLCKSLSSQFDLYIVTNGVEFIQKRRFAKSGLAPYFKGVFISGVIGYEKPAVEYFETVAKEIPSFDKSRAIIVGDSLSSDIKGGIAYGIDTLWYNPQSKPLPSEMQITSVVHSFNEIYSFLVGE